MADFGFSAISRDIYLTKYNLKQKHRVSVAKVGTEHPQVKMSQVSTNSTNAFSF